MTLRIRWLGRVPYREAATLQRALWSSRTGDDWLLLLEHPHVYTLGVRADPAHVLTDPDTVGADLVSTDRGGDVTYHGPGQLVGYPIRSVRVERGAIPAHVHAIEQLVIDALVEVGLAGAHREPDYPGVWVGAGARARKICAVGVRISRGRSMHGFALNVAPELGMFGHIVPCGIADRAVTSLAAEGVEVDLHRVTDTVAALAAERWGGSGWERHDVAWRVRPTDLAPFSRGEGRTEPLTSGPTRGTAPGPADPGASEGVAVRLRGRLAEAAAQAGAVLPAPVPLTERKPAWMRVRAEMGPAYRALRSTMRSLDLVTVCEEAGCPNIYECWADGTATFMINGDRCTRACGFCLVDTRKPGAPDPGEPARVAEAVARMGLRHAVVTAVARDDLDDGGAAGFAATIAAIRDRSPGTAVEVLIPDCQGRTPALAAIFGAGPDVLNHNMETVPRLQRAVRPSASYARSLAVLAAARAAGLRTKSGLIVGMGETEDEVTATLADLAGVGLDIATIGQYLRPTAAHLPVARWWAPEEFDRLRLVGEGMGIGHVEASPLTRSSYHARQAAEASPAPARVAG